MKKAVSLFSHYPIFPTCLQECGLFTIHDVSQTAEFDFDSRLYYWVSVGRKTTIKDTDVPSSILINITTPNKAGRTEFNALREEVDSGLSDVKAALYDKADTDHTHTEFGEIQKLSNTTETPATAGQVLTATATGAEYADLPNALSLTNGTLQVANPPASTAWTGNIGISTSGQIILANAGDTQVNGRTPLSYGGGQFLGVNEIDYAVRASLTDSKNTLIYTDEQKETACARLGAVNSASNEWRLIANETTKEEKDRIEVNATLKEWHLLVTVTTASSTANVSFYAVDSNGTNRTLRTVGSFLRTGGTSYGVFSFVNGLLYTPHSFTSSPATTGVMTNNAASVFNMIKDGITVLKLIPTTSGVKFPVGTQYTVIGR